MEKPKKKKVSFKGLVGIGLVGVSLGATLVSPQFASALDAIYCLWDEARVVSLETKVDTLKADLEIEQARADRIENAFENTTTLTTTRTLGSNYSSGSASAVLVGNDLRLYFTATRSSATSGNITNETVMTITVDHGGKIKDIYTIGATSGTTGARVALTSGATSNNGTTATFTITLSALITSENSFNSYFSVPVTLNPDAF